MGFTHIDNSVTYHEIQFGGIAMAMHCVTFINALYLFLSSFPSSFPFLLSYFSCLYHERNINSMSLDYCSNTLVFPIKYPFSRKWRSFSKMVFIGFLCHKLWRCWAALDKASQHIGHFFGTATRSRKMSSLNRAE